MNEVRGALVFLVVVVGSSGGAKSSPVRLGVVLRDEYDLLSTATAITRNLSRRSSGLDLMVGLTLIPSAVPKGAVCLDGSLPGYHLHPGFGSGNNSWLIQLEGGGWCNTIQNCVSRKNTRLGSSKYMEKALPFVGILSDKPDENPDLYNWNRVKLRYCDGASFSGEGHNETSQLYFRGKRIWLAGMEDLMAKGMHNADQALLSGQSAGALASMLRCDEFRQLFPATIRVKCLSDAGLFLDATNGDLIIGRTLRNMFASVVRLHMVQKNLLQNCTSRLDPTSCFFPQNYIDDIKTPLFVLKSAYDAWQISECLAPLAADPNNDWHNCKLDHMLCNTSQIQSLQDFRSQMLDAVDGFSKSKKNGVFINSCFAHVQTERKGMWFAYDSPMIGDKRVAEAIGDWYFERARDNIAIDCPYPCDNTCQNIAVEHGDGSLHRSM